MLCLILIGGAGLLSGLGSLEEARTAGQRVTTATQFLYVALSALAIVGLLTRQRWTDPILLGWAAAVPVTAGLAPIVWGGAPLGAGLAAAGAALLIALVVLWFARRAERARGT